MNIFDLINFIAYLAFIGALGYYAITTLQWYSYRLNRAIFHHSKAWWNITYFLLPFIIYELLYATGNGKFSFVIVLIYLPLLWLWYRKLDKPLVWTGRVKRFFAALYLMALFFFFVLKIPTIILPLALAWLISVGIEKMLFYGFKQKAKKRLDSHKNMIIIGVTASYGKTSIKNFIAQILKKRYKVYATPRSVNTLGGILKDINEDLPDNTEVYIAEMGARGEGDIAEIATFLNPQYAVVGTIGPAHIEYFKTLERIRNTKMEIIRSERLREAWVHSSANVKETENIHTFGDDIKDVEATLEHTCFSMDNVRYCASVLGAFNAVNLAAAVKVAKALGMKDEEIDKALKDIEPTPHRLQRIDAGGKLILDDSFNGNIDGMMGSFELASQYPGRKVLITPGLVEADEELNEKVARKANEIFDLIVVTGSLNVDIFKKNVDKDKYRSLEDKSQLENFLIKETAAGDLILFANDAPNFI